MYARARARIYVSKRWKSVNRCRRKRPHEYLMEGKRRERSEWGNKNKCWTRCHYIGKEKNTLEERKKRHSSSCRKNKSKKRDTGHDDSSCLFSVRLDYVVSFDVTFQRSEREKTMTFLLLLKKLSKKRDTVHDDSSCLFSMLLDHVVAFDITFERSEREKRTTLFLPQ